MYEISQYCRYYPQILVYIQVQGQFEYSNYRKNQCNELMASYGPMIEKTQPWKFRVRQLSMGGWLSIAKHPSGSVQRLEHMAKPTKCLQLMLVPTCPKCSCRQVSQKPWLETFSHESGYIITL